MSRRQYPVIAKSGDAPRRSVSFVVVRFGDDYIHNIFRSQCVHNPLNQLITVDNRCNLFFDNLSQAINAGLDQARHELVAVVHDDVLLPDGWQAQFERSLGELEETDPNWGLLGSVGWGSDEGALAVGHWSDPHTYKNTFREKSFTRVEKIDEQLMIFRKSSGLRFDDLLPSIHNIGRSQASVLQRQGLRTYVVNAPTIHKYADAAGRQIERAPDSPKIQARKLPAYLADLACCNEYLYHEWPEWRPDDFSEQDWEMAGFRRDIFDRSTDPVILLSRGGSGSRLLSSLAQDAGVFLGNDLNVSGDTMEMVEGIYMGVLNKYQTRASWQKERTVPRIRLAAVRMIQRAEYQNTRLLPRVRSAIVGVLGQAKPATPPLWGFKLPECMLLLPELHQAFGNARYVHLIRDPLTTCLRRTHMTARFDNTIGRVSIREAYRYCGRDLAQSLDDSPGLHMAYTTIHQIETVRDYARTHLGDRYLEIRFEEVLEDPCGVLTRVGDWMGTTVRGSKLKREVDPARGGTSVAGHPYPRDVEEAIVHTLEPLRRALGYV